MAVDAQDQDAVIEPLEGRHGLCFVACQSGAHHGRIVVGSCAPAQAAQRDALGHDDLERDRRRECRLREQRFGLSDGPGEAVEDVAVAIEVGLDDRGDEPAGYQPSRGDQPFNRAAQRRARRDLGAQEIARRDVLHAEPPGQTDALHALSGSGATRNQYPRTGNLGIRRIKSSSDDFKTPFKKAANWGAPSRGRTFRSPRSGVSKPSQSTM